MSDGVGNGEQLGIQATGAIATVIWSAVATFGIVPVMKAFVPLRASDDEMAEGLDLSHHGERDHNV